MLLLCYFTNLSWNVNIFIVHAVQFCYIMWNRAVTGSLLGNRLIDVFAPFDYMYYYFAQRIDVTCATTLFFYFFLFFINFSRKLQPLSVTLYIVNDLLCNVYTVNVYKLEW